MFETVEKHQAKAGTNNGATFTFDQPGLQVHHQLGGGVGHHGVGLSTWRVSGEPTASQSGRDFKKHRSPVPSLSGFLSFHFSPLQHFYLFQAVLDFCIRTGFVVQ